MKFGLADQLADHIRSQGTHAAPPAVHVETVLARVNVGIRGRTAMSRSPEAARLSRSSWRIGTMRTLAVMRSALSGTSNLRVTE